jgi:Transmembrane family 220, helix
MRKTIALIFGIVFLLFAAVQYNDPDPQVWIPIYLAAVMACGMAWAGLGQWWFFGLMAAIYAVAAWYQWPPHFEGFLLNQVGMKTLNIELAREAGGLLICAGAMGWLGVVSREGMKS